jgi:hypothetical protein
LSARKQHLVRSNPPRRQEADVRRPDDFTDPESEHVLDAMFDALIEPLAIQTAREHENARQRGRK